MLNVRTKARGAAAAAGQAEAAAQAAQAEAARLAAEREQARKDADQLAKDAERERRQAVAEAETLAGRLEADLDAAVTAARSDPALASLDVRRRARGMLWGSGTEPGRHINGLAECDEHAGALFALEQVAMRLEDRCGGELALHPGEPVVARVAACERRAWGEFVRRAHALAGELVTP